MPEPGSPPRCYTIGYGNDPLDRFIGRLRTPVIDTVVDIRSIPYSRFRPDFNRENLRETLAKDSLGYRFMGDRLGGKVTDPDLLRPDGSVDFRKVRETERFREGIADLAGIIAEGQIVALMCAELEPERCHRFVLVTPALQGAGIEVVHIMADGSLQPNRELEAELAGLLFDRSQTDLAGRQPDFTAMVYERIGSGTRDRRR